jgi:hypothetical protein
VDEWTAENVKTYDKLAESDKCKWTLRTLWDIAYRYDRDAYRIACSMDSGQPDPLVLQQILDYKKQKEYWEKFAFYVAGDKEALVYVRDWKYGEYIGDGLKMSELKQ